MYSKHLLEVTESICINSIFVSDLLCMKKLRGLEKELGFRYFSWPRAQNIGQFRLIILQMAAK
jgi:hypothetical protein